MALISSAAPNSTSHSHIFSPAAAAASKSSAHFRYSSTLVLPGIRAQQSAELLPRHHAATATAAPYTGHLPGYTSMRSDPLAFWDSHNGLQLQQQHPLGLLFTDEDAEALFLAAELRLLATAASDRAEMHAILAQQRDNWNKLFQRMLTAACMTACMLSGLDGQAHSLSLSLPALLLNAGSAAMMAIINQFQPSQLAEEQRTAARLFRKLASDVHYALNVAPHLRQDTPSFLRDCQRRLQALDKAFPMPLTPGGLEKFPTKVAPPVLKEPLSVPSSRICVKDIASQHFSERNINGWDGHLTHDLLEVADMLRRSDIPKYTGWAQNLVKINKCFAVAAPLLAASAAVLNALVIGSMVAHPTALGVWSAVCSVLAAFMGSFSHDTQLGMVFELYRNSAGYYADIEAAIRETLGTRAEERENGTLFRQRVAYQRVAYQLGRSPIIASAQAPLCRLVPADAQEAGTLF